MTLRSRLLLLSGMTLTAVLITVGVLFQVVVLGPVVADERDRFTRELSLAADLVSRWDDVSAEEGVHRLDDLLGYRVTLLAEDGSVWADSGVGEGDGALLENHADRPEFIAALAGELPEVERRSSTVGRESLYVATRVTFLGEPAVLRLAQPAALLRRPLRNTVVILIGVGAIGLLAAGLGGMAVVSAVRSPLARLEERVTAIAGGDFGSRPIRAPYPPEFEALAATIQRLAGELDERFHEVARERDEMQSLIDSIAEGVIALTDDARVLRMNRAAAEILEIDPPAPFTPVGTLVRHPELRDRLEESVVHPLPPKEIVPGTRNLLVSSYFTEPGGAVVTLLDVTELRRIEKVRRDFVANASHELKTPLTAMRGFAETLLEGDPPEELRQQFLNSIHTNTVRLQHLVDDLLDLSRLESGTWTVREDEVDVGELVEEVWSELHTEHRGREVEFHVEGEAIVLADEQALHQIFRNLFDNALRFTPDGGEIRVELSDTGPEARIAVTDTGAGIPSDSLPRIFERFYRGDAGRDRSVGGTGLGLSIVRHLVQSMGGEVGAGSRLGKGTTIYFTLPRVESI